MTNMFHTVLNSTNSGRNSYYGIGQVINTGGCHYTIQSAFTAEFSNGMKPIIHICTYEFGDKAHRKLSFHVLHKLTDEERQMEGNVNFLGDYSGFGYIPGAYNYEQKVNHGKIGYEIKTNQGRLQVVHEFTLNGKKCFVGCLKHFNLTYPLEVFWYNEEKDKYYRIMPKNV